MGKAKKIGKIIAGIFDALIFFLAIYLLDFFFSAMQHTNNPLIVYFGLQFGILGFIVLIVAIIVAWLIKRW